MILDFYDGDWGWVCGLSDDWLACVIDSDVSYDLGAFELWIFVPVDCCFPVCWLYWFWLIVMSWSAWLLWGSEVIMLWIVNLLWLVFLTCLDSDLCEFFWLLICLTHFSLCWMIFLLITLTGLLDCVSLCGLMWMCWCCDFFDVNVLWLLKWIDVLLLTSTCPLTDSYDCPDLMCSYWFGVGGCDCVFGCAVIVLTPLIYATTLLTDWWTWIFLISFFLLSVLCLNDDWCSVWPAVDDRWYDMLLLLFDMLCDELFDVCMLCWSVGSVSSCWSLLLWLGHGCAAWCVTFFCCLDLFDPRSLLCDCACLCCLCCWLNWHDGGVTLIVEFVDPWLISVSWSGCDDRILLTCSFLDE